jgi:hypothetical protein
MKLFMYEDPEHWRSRAEEMRVLAEAIVHPEPKAIMFRIADDYDKLAEFAERAKLENDSH